MLEQDSPPAACLSASPSSRLGGKGQDGKKNVQVTHRPPRRAHPGGGRGRGTQGDSAEAGLQIALLIPVVDTSRTLNSIDTDMGTLRRHIKTRG